MPEPRFKTGEWVFEVERKLEHKSILSSFFKKDPPKALHISGTTSIRDVVVYEFINCKILRGVNGVDVHYRLATEREIRETKIKDIFKDNK